MSELTSFPRLGGEDAAAAFPAGKTVAVVGGGQLGRMLALAGLPLGVDFAFLDPSGDRCAAAPLAARVEQGGLYDASALTALAAGADVVTCGRARRGRRRRGRAVARAPTS